MATWTLVIPTQCAWSMQLPPEASNSFQFAPEANGGTEVLSLATHKAARFAGTSLVSSPHAVTAHSPQLQPRQQPDPPDWPPTRRCQPEDPPGQSASCNSAWPPPPPAQKSFPSPGRMRKIGSTLCPWPGSQHVRPDLDSGPPGGTPNSGPSGHCPSHHGAFPPVSTAAARLELDPLPVWAGVTASRGTAPTFRRRRRSR